MSKRMYGVFWSSKAFHTVDFPIRFGKLNKCDDRDLINDCFISYLCQRKQ